MFRFETTGKRGRLVWTFVWTSVLICKFGTFTCHAPHYLYAYTARLMFAQP